MIGFENIDDEADDGSGGVELATLLPLGHGELAEEVFVDEAEGVAFLIHGDGGHDFEEFGEGAVFENLERLGQHVSEVGFSFSTARMASLTALPSSAPSGSCSRWGKCASSGR